MAAWLRARVPASRVLVLPSQTPGVIERFGISRAEADRALQTVTADGRRAAAAAAVNTILREMGGPWRLAARVAALPGCFWLEERAYHGFARHRRRFARWGITPACAEPGDGQP